MLDGLCNEMKFILILVKTENSELQKHTLNKIYYNVYKMFEI